MEKKPNILIIMTDQHRWDLMSCCRKDSVPTPNIDRLAREGTMFDNAYCQAPMCVPSRMAFLTGCYPHNVGIIGNHDCLDWRHRTLAHHFNDHGYLTGLIGKMHFVDAHNHGFEYYLSINDWLMYLGPKARLYAEEIANNPLSKRYLQTVQDGGSGFPDVEGLWPDEHSPWEGHVNQIAVEKIESSLDQEDTLDMFVARETIRFLEQNREGPFMLISGFMRPHPPMFAPSEWAAKYPVPDQQLPEPGNTEPYPQCIRDRIDQFRLLGGDRLRKDRAGYRANLAFVDYCVGQILDAVNRLELEDDTIVIYTSDHGDMDGEHGLFHKTVFFDPAVKIPLIIRVPGRTERGSRRPGLVELMDLYPTLCDLCGTEPPEGIEGRSFAAHLLDSSSPAKEVVYSEIENRAFMIRRGSFKYNFNRDDTDELYDLNRDPRENVNLVNEPEYRSTVAELHQCLCCQYPEMES